MVVLLENNYCEASDVLRVANITTIPDSQTLSRINESINKASRLIEDYCNTVFYEKDYSVTPLDLRFVFNWSAFGSALFLPFPISIITEIEEDGKVILASNYLVPDDSFAKLVRLEDDELADWGIKLKIKGKFGYKNSAGCDSDYLNLPGAIITQCALAAAYLAELKDVKAENTDLVTTKVDVDSGNRVQALPQGRSFIESYLSPSTGQQTTQPQLYTSRLAQDTLAGPSIVTEANAVGYSVPIDRTKTSTTTQGQGLSYKGVLPRNIFEPLSRYRIPSL